MTQIFLDTASTDEIRRFLSQGIGNGVTTNQKIILSEGSIDLKERIVEICALRPDWPVSVETTTKTVDALVAEAEEYASWHPNVVIKVAMDKDGVALKVAQKLQEMGIRTNLTAMVTINQLYLAAGAGATYVSLFFNRARDAGIDAIATIEKVVPLLERHTEAQLICGSIRKPGDVEEILCARRAHRDHPSQGPHPDALPLQDGGDHSGVRSGLVGVHGGKQPPHPDADRR